MRVTVNEEGNLEFSEVYNPICIRTEQGVFGIAHRDNGIEVVKDGEIVWSTIGSHKVREKQGGITVGFASEDESVCLPCAHLRRLLDQSGAGDEWEPVKHNDVEPGLCCVDCDARIDKRARLAKSLRERVHEFAPINQPSPETTRFMLRKEDEGQNEVPNEGHVDEKPVELILHCPMCHARHVDRGEMAVTNHKTHACQACGHQWRPANVPTVGVQFLEGCKDEPDHLVGVSATIAVADTPDPEPKLEEQEAQRLKAIGGPTQADGFHRTEAMREVERERKEREASSKGFVDKIRTVEVYEMLMQLDTWVDQLDVSTQHALSDDHVLARLIEKVKRWRRQGRYGMDQALAFTESHIVHRCPVCKVHRIHVYVANGLWQCVECRDPYLGPEREDVVRERARIGRLIRMHADRLGQVASLSRVQELRELADSIHKPACATCEDKGEVLHRTERPGGPPAHNLHPCPDCDTEPEAKGTHDG